MESVERIEIVVLRVNDPDQCTCLRKDGFDVELRVEIVDLAGSLPYLKVHKGVDWVFENAGCGFKKERVGWRQFVKDDGGDGGFAGPDRRNISDGPIGTE